MIPLLAGAAVAIGAVLLLSILLWGLLGAAIERSLARGGPR